MAAFRWRSSCNWSASCPEAKAGNPRVATEEPRPGSRESGRHEISDDGSRVFWSGQEGSRTFVSPRHCEGRNAGQGDSGARSNSRPPRRRVARILHCRKKRSKSRRDIGSLQCDGSRRQARLQNDGVGARSAGQPCSAQAKTARTCTSSRRPIGRESSSRLRTISMSITDTRYEVGSAGYRTLPEEDENDWDRRPRVTDGACVARRQWLAFMSRESLTGYDNGDAVSGDRTGRCTSTTRETGADVRIVRADRGEAGRPG